ncbi:MAG: helix-hairpin-helix domain-containing protein [Evtepia gabavorous]
MDTSPSELILLDGTVSSVIYRNEENGYTILRLEAPEAGEEVTVVGTMPGISPGEGLSVHGQWTRHSTYGEQFRAEIVERRMPVGEKALLEYLASGAVKGVGAAMARRLLDAFGGGCADGDRGGPPPAHRGEGHLPQTGGDHPPVPVCGFPCGGCWIFSPPMGSPSPGHAPVPAVYGDLALTALRANPYLLTEEPLFTPFPAADKLARELGLEADDPLRLEAGLLYTLSHNLDNGHVFSPMLKLLTRRPAAAETESSVLEDHLEGLTDRGTIVREKLPARMPATWPGSTTARPMWPTPCWRWRGNRSAPQRTWTRSWTEFSGNRVSPTPPCRWRR